LYWIYIYIYVFISFTIHRADGPGGRPSSFQAAARQFLVFVASSNIIRMNISRRVRCAGHVARMGAMRNAYSIFVGKPEKKKPFRRPRRR
jgi:hypothetical protein